MSAITFVSVAYVLPGFMDARPSDDEDSNNKNNKNKSQTQGSFRFAIAPGKECLVTRFVETPTPTRTNNP